MCKSPTETLNPSATKATSHPTGRASEQNASIFGHKGKDAQAAGAKAVTVPILKDEHSRRFRGMPDTPNERLTTVLRARANTRRENACRAYTLARC